MLGQLDLVSFVAHHSHIIAQQIDARRQTVDGGCATPAARRPDGGAAARRRHPHRAHRALVTELNRRLFARLWRCWRRLDLVADSCLLVMGSEAAASRS